MIQDKKAKPTGKKSQAEKKVVIHKAASSGLALCGEITEFTVKDWNPVTCSKCKEAGK